MLTAGIHRHGNPLLVWPQFILGSFTLVAGGKVKHEVLNGSQSWFYHLPVVHLDSKIPLEGDVHILRPVACQTAIQVNGVKQQP